MSTNTETAQQIQHTPGAIRAADAIFKRYDLGECEYTAAGAAGVAQDHRELVELIDRETCAPDLLYQLYMVLPYLEQLRDDEAESPKPLYKQGVLATLVKDTLAAIAKAEART